MSRSRHISIHIDTPPAVVYAFAADVGHLPRWAAGLARSPVSVDGEELLVDSPMGTVRVRFVPPNEYGVLDHVVTLPSGEQVLNPLRVLPDGEGCEVVFTVRRRPGMTDEQFDADCRAVAADLDALRR